MSDSRNVRPLGGETERVTQIFAHRGASAAAGDNTRAAFELAVALGADGVELDVRRTRDGVLVVHHDPVLADGRAVASVEAVDLPDRVLHLDAALEACEPVSVNVEIKNDANEPGFTDGAEIAAQVGEALARLGTDDRWIISSFDLATVAAVRELYPQFRTALLTTSIADDDIDRAVAAGIGAINPSDDAVTRLTLDRARAVGLEVWPWTVDGEQRLSELMSWGVDGLFTNVPDLALRVRSELQQGPD